MAEDAVDVVRRWTMALGRGDPAPEMCDPKVEISNWAESPVPGPYFGLDGVRQWWLDLSDSFSDVRFQVQYIERIDGERVLTSQRLIGTFRLTGIELDHLWGSIISVRDGKIVSAVGYMSPNRARRAAGRD